MERRSPLSNRDLLAAAIEGAESKKEVIERLGLRSAGANYAKLVKYAEVHGLELPTPIRKPRPPVPLAEVFKENSTYTSGTNVKRRLYSLGVKEICVECGIGPEWNGGRLTLQIDHINGVHSDNRLENLALLCPNCHSQTDSYAGANTKDRTDEAIGRGPYYSSNLLTEFEDGSSKHLDRISALEDNAESGGEQHGNL